MHASPTVGSHVKIFARSGGASASAARGVCCLTVLVHAHRRKAEKRRRCCRSLWRWCRSRTRARRLRGVPQKVANGVVVLGLIQGRRSVTVPGSAGAGAEEAPEAPPEPTPPASNAPDEAPRSRGSCGAILALPEAADSPRATRGQTEKEEAEARSSAPARGTAFHPRKQGAGSPIHCSRVTSREIERGSDS